MALERSDNILTLIFNRVFHTFGHTSGSVELGMRKKSRVFSRLYTSEKFRAIVN